MLGKTEATAGFSSSNRSRNCLEKRYCDYDTAPARQGHLEHGVRLRLFGVLSGHVISPEPGDMHDDSEKSGQGWFAI